MHQGKRSRRIAHRRAAWVVIGIVGAVGLSRAHGRERDRLERSALCFELREARTPTIDLDTADAARMEVLPGLGPERARRIVRYREIFGRIQPTIDPALVPGIGPALVAALAPFVRTVHADVERRSGGARR